MTNADVAKVIAKAAERGIEINKYDASIFLAAQEILVREPDNATAREVVTNFQTWMTTSKEPLSFAEFLLPEDSIYTVEEKAEQARSRNEYLEATSKEN